MSCKKIRLIYKNLKWAQYKWLGQVHSLRVYCRVMKNHNLNLVTTAHWKRFEKRMKKDEKFRYIKYGHTISSLRPAYLHS